MFERTGHLSKESKQVLHPFQPFSLQVNGETVPPTALGQKQRFVQLSSESRCAWFEQTGSRLRVSSNSCLSETFSYLLLDLSKIFSILKVCMTESGATPNLPCIFPFRHWGKTYWTCTTDGDKKPWCSTKWVFFGLTLTLIFCCFILCLGFMI